MSYIINHNRGQCAAQYNQLVNSNLNKISNEKCTVLGFKTSGSFNGVDISFNENTWLENSLDLLGIKYNIAISPKSWQTVSYTDKIPLVLELLKQTEYEYAIIADTVDSIIVDNPDKVVNILNVYGCDILFSTTRWPDHDMYTMPDRYVFNQSLYEPFYLNGGVCAGRTSSLIKLYERILEYAAFDTPIIQYIPTYRRENGYRHWTKDQLKDFPKGVSCDQTILRYLLKEFYPSLKLDIRNLLAAPR